MSDAPECTQLTADLIARLRAIVGPQHALTDPDLQLPYLREWRDKYEGRASIVLRPGTTAEVAQIMELAHAYGIPVVPQAGNTGLVGGQVPMQGEILLSVGRLKRVRAIDAAGYTMTVEAGLTLAAAQAAADRVDRLFPLSLPSENSCQIGGNLAINAGGTSVLAYGNARQLVLGLEVALADGRVWDGLRGLKKDNTGYDLKDLFIGSEGTLGIITAAVLKLFPKPAEKATAFVALPDIASALSLYSLAQEAAGQSLTAYEVMAGIVLDLVLRHMPGTRDPFAARHPWYALIETSGLKADGGAERVLTEVLTAASERGIIGDAAIAGSLAQARDFWRLREVLFACAKARRRQRQERRLRAGGQDPRAHHARGCGGRAPVPGCAPSSACALRRRQRALQHRAANGYGEAVLSCTVGGDDAGGPRHRRRSRRVNLCRARHRADEAR